VGRVAPLADRAALGAFLGRDPALYAYHLGDLDDAFWPRTRWWGLLEPDGAPREVALLYDGGDPPTLLALSRDPAGLRELLAGLGEALPRRVYAHLSPGAREALGPRWRSEPHGLHLEMRLVDPAPADALEPVGVARLGPADLQALQELYRRAYPGNWFDPRMLATGFYFGAWREGALLSVAGVHVVSVAWRVAALGNVTTDPAARGQGLAARVTAATVRALCAAGVVEVGLNVHASNAAAIACYRRLGFAPVAEYEEHLLERA
jgi:ribosomal protein S18 acetylase RimI-like enzyme